MVKLVVVLEQHSNHTIDGNVFKLQELLTMHRSVRNNGLVNIQEDTLWAVVAEYTLSKICVLCELLVVTASGRNPLKARTLR